MDYENLIEAVSGYKLLYDLSDKRYCDHLKKDQVWSEIGRKINMNGSECKKAWTLLRDSFRRTLKRRKKNLTSTKKWKYEDEMAFLLPYMKERPIRPIPTKVATDDDNDDNYEESFIEETPQSPDVDQQMTQQSGTLPATLPATLQPEIPSTILMKYIDSKKNAPPDDIEQFMTGITTTLRSFPARDRAIAKARIFEIVSQMEIEILSRPSSSHYMEPTPIQYYIKEENIEVSMTDTI